MDTNDLNIQESADIFGKESEQKLTRQQIWERKLLDFSLRNNLLNLRLGKRAIPFVSFQIDHVEDYLFEGADYQVLPCPAERRIEPNEYGMHDSRLHREALEKIVIEGLEKKRLCSYLSEEELKTALKNIFRSSRTALEENGANSLFVAFGMLKWYETEKVEKPRYAPLLLVPVSIVRKTGNSYVIRMRDEEVTFNTTLTEMLKQQFGISLSPIYPLPQDDHGIDVRKVLDTVTAAIQPQKRWEVVEECVLGLFSFNKFVMWNDIHNNADKMCKNTIIDSLLKNHWTGQTSAKSVNAQEIDRTVQPSEFAIPVDVDSSQMEAVVQSGEGNSFILYGPPGTGKSQTITNMIANALYHGRRVLFVAEKMAALQVVQKRLAKIGLAPFCLELHSNKVTKKHLLDQLQSTLELTHIKEPAEYKTLSDQLFSERRKLSTYVELLHRRQPTGLSLYDYFTRYSAIAQEPIQPHAQFLANITEQKLLSAAEQVALLDTVLSIVGAPEQHPLFGLNVYDASMGTMQLLGSRLPQMEQCANVASQLLSRIQATSPCKLQNNISSVKWLCQYIMAQENVTRSYGANILAENASALREEWNQLCNKFFITRFFSKRSFVKRLKAYSKNISKANVEQVIRLLEQHQQLLHNVGLTQPLFPTQQEVQMCRNLVGIVTEILPVCDFDNENLIALRNKLPIWIQHLTESRDWTQWCQRKRSLRNAYLGNVVDYICQQHANAHDASEALCKGVYRQLAMQTIDTTPELQMFNGLLFEQAIEKYRDLAARFQTITKKMLYCKLAANIPTQALAPMSGSEMGILKRYIASGGRGVTIRHIMDQLPTLMPRLCPVMLMSPLSVAQFIDLEQKPFDIVCFDEASQMPTSEAIGAIARGKALICVGDPKQMPPTNFFAVNAVEDSEADIDDMESILDDCITLSLPAHYLTWHYRSRHESLIAFSNQQFYDGRLFTFPSVDDRASKVRLIPVDGVYDYGKTRCNRKEAEAIVAEVVRRLSDEELSKRSIGIVSFSKVQQDLIEDLLTEELAKHPDLEAKAYDAEEPIFIKNLENVQGDERDVILFSIGYGPDETGKVSMNFGPLNNSGGERRLNVAVSRARYEMLVFSTLQPEQIDLNRSNARGVECLKYFLEFARNGQRSADNGQSSMVNGQSSTVNNQSSIVEAIAETIREQGYVVDTNIGRSQFKIDIGVVDPDHDDQYLLGIMCDGEVYYKTKTERDREICQPGVLKGLGWNIMRVWAVDWFMGKETVTQRIMQKLQEVKQMQTAESSPQSSTTNPQPSSLNHQPSTINPQPSVPFTIEKGDVITDKEVAKACPSMKRYMRNGKLSIENIPQSEIEKVVLFAVEQGVSIPLDDLKRQCAKLLGFAQRGKNIDMAVETAVRSLLYRQQLAQNNGNIVLFSV